MSTKPIDTGRFAVDGADADAANISAPSSGLRDTGWPTNGIPTAANFNYLENIAYRWRKYLSDGALTGDHTITGTLAVSGNLSSGGALAVTSNETVGGTLAVTGATTVGSTLGVTGATTVGGTLGVTGASTQAAITASGLITANGGVVFGANQNLTLSGTGAVNHGSWTKIINPAPNTGANTNSFAEIGVSAPGSPLLATVQLSPHFIVGDVITAIRVRVTDSGVGPSPMRFIFSSQTATSANTIGISTTTLGNGTVQVRSLTGLSELIVSGSCHYVVVDFPAGNTGDCIVWDVEVDFTH